MKKFLSYLLFLFLLIIGAILLCSSILSILSFMRLSNNTLWLLITLLLDIAYIYLVIKNKKHIKNAYNIINDKKEIKNTNIDLEKNKEQVKTDLKNLLNNLEKLLSFKSIFGLVILFIAISYYFNGGEDKISEKKSPVINNNIVYQDNQINTYVIKVDPTKEHHMEFIGCDTEKNLKLFNDSINSRIKENYVKPFIQNGNCKWITNMKKETYLIKIVDVKNNRTKKILLMDKGNSEKYYFVDVYFKGSELFD